MPIDLYTKKFSWVLAAALLFCLPHFIVEIILVNPRDLAMAYITAIGFLSFLLMIALVFDVFNEYW